MSTLELAFICITILLSVSIIADVIKTHIKTKNRIKEFEFFDSVQKDIKNDWIRYFS